MKRSIKILSVLFILFSCNIYALDMDEAADTYFSFQDQLNELSANDRQARSTSSIILEGYVVSGQSGLVLASQETIRGSFTKSQIQSIVSSTLYEQNGFGLYDYSGFNLQVWYEGNYASVITLMVYTP